MSKPNDIARVYHAEATALRGNIIQPLKGKINPQVFNKLHGLEGNYRSQHSDGFRFEHILSYKSAYTHVAGYRSKFVNNVDNFDKRPGWTTVSTSVVEGLNIMEVLTADRIVSQVSTVHRADVHLPTVSFLGTRFENVRIAGQKVSIELNTQIFGKDPLSIHDYPDTHKLYDSVRDCPKLKTDFAGRYLEERGEGQASGQEAAASTGGVHASLVTSVEVEGKGEFPGTTHGSMINLTNFGQIYFAPFKLTQSGVDKNGHPETLLEIKMLAIRMGCLADGDVDAGGCVINGATE
jgi:hypothetical protein